MKVTTNKETKFKSSPIYPYVARHRGNGTLVLVGRYSVIKLTFEDGSDPGDGWSSSKDILYLFEPVEETVTLQNEFE